MVLYDCVRFLSLDTKLQFSVGDRFDIEKAKIKAQYIIFMSNAWNFYGDCRVELTIEAVSLTLCQLTNLQ